MGIINFFMGALLPGTGTDRARITSRTTQTKEGKWLPSGEIFLEHSTTHPLTILRAQTSTAAGSSNEPVQEVTIPSSSGLFSLELDVTLIKEFAHHPVGGCLSRFRKNWEKSHGTVGFIDSPRTKVRVFHSTLVK